MGDDKRGRKDTKRGGNPHERIWIINIRPGKTASKKRPMIRVKLE